MINEKPTCERCIHKQICPARTDFHSVAKSWNERYPFVKMSYDLDNLAKVCIEYKTLTGIFIIDKTITDADSIESSNESKLFKKWRR